MKKVYLLPMCAALVAAPYVLTLGAQAASPVPTAPGQAAFGAIGEIVRLLQADANTDWSKVNLEALRQHLIDMDAVVMRSDVSQKQIAGGFEARVTGSGTTVGSIQRLATNHAGMLNMMSDYRATVEQLPSGIRMSVTSRTANDEKAVARVRGLGFIGLLTEGNHHQPHHLSMARGEMVHKH